MARSTYIYTLTQYGTIFGSATVKKELALAIKRTIPEHLWSEYKVQRWIDGRITFEAAVHTYPTVKEFVNGS